MVSIYYGKQIHVNKGEMNMSEADYQVEQQLEKAMRINFSGYSESTVDTRSILNRLSNDEIKRIASEIFNEGARTDIKFEKMNVQLMNALYDLSSKQKNALITFIMYAN